jgi:beta-alanine degradation protein BauB
MKRSGSLMVLAAAAFAPAWLACEPDRGEAVPNGAAEQSAESRATRRLPQFENDDVRVWKTIIEPNQPLNMHRHDFGRVIVALKGGTLTVVPQSGERKNVVWASGNAYWLAADPPGVLHGDVNEGADAIEVMVIELRR